MERSPLWIASAVHHAVGAGVRMSQRPSRLFVVTMVKLLPPSGQVPLTCKLTQLQLPGSWSQRSEMRGQSRSGACFQWTLKASTLSFQKNSRADAASSLIEQFFDRPIIGIGARKALLAT